MNLQQGSRRRGVILTLQGLKKLQDAKSEAESRDNFDKRYTFEALSFRTGLDSDTLRKVLACEIGVDKSTLRHCYAAFNLQLEASDYQLSQPDAAISTQHLIENPKSSSAAARSAIRNKIDWGTAPDVSVFYGRTEELATLKHWILAEGCRLVTIAGMVGMGKTSLSVKLAQQIQNEFEFVIWRSLRNTPPIQDLLAELIRFFSNQQENTEGSPLPDTIDRSILRLMEYLKKHRCLLILDNVESILSNSNGTTYRSGYEGYGQLFRCVGDSLHQSCLILTATQKPKWLSYKEGQNLPLRSLKLIGLQPTEVKAIFQSKGCCCKSPVECSRCESLPLCTRLTNYYAGNPLLLKLISTSICNLFDGHIPEFVNQEIAIFGKVCQVFEQQFKGLSEEEKEAIEWLAINGKPASFAEMRSHLLRSLSPQKLLGVLESLQERSLIEKKAALFFMQPVMRDYVANQVAATNITQFPLKDGFSSVG